MQVGQQVRQVGCDDDLLPSVTLASFFDRQVRAGIGPLQGQVSPGQVQVRRQVPQSTTGETITETSITLSPGNVQYLNHVDRDASVSPSPNDDDDGLDLSLSGCERVGG